MLQHQKNQGVCLSKIKKKKANKKKTKQKFNLKDTQNSSLTCFLVLPPLSLKKIQDNLHFLQQFSCATTDKAIQVHGKRLQFPTVTRLKNKTMLRKQMVSPCCFLTLMLQNGHKLCTEKKNLHFTHNWKPETVLFANKLSISVAPRKNIKDMST